jgi:hypothetical protein
LGKVRLLGDLVLAAFFGGEKAKDRERKRSEFVSSVVGGEADRFRGWLDEKRNVDPPLAPFHWEVEFPEVFERQNGGFDSIVGNPPFLGGKRICLVLGDVYRDYLKATWSHSKGAADLCAYFFLRASSIVRDEGTIGFLSTNSIAQGDTREVCLDFLCGNGFFIVNAIRSMPWPGTAGVSIARVILHKGAWNGEYLLDGKSVKTISAHLEPFDFVGTPKKLVMPIEDASYGTGILGIGFTLPELEAKTWIAQEPKYTEVLFPYLNGEDLNSSPTLTPTRWVIDFHDWPEDRAAEYGKAMDRVRELVKPQRDRLTRQIHEECYWKHWDKRDALYSAMKGLDEVLVVSLVTQHLSFAFVPTGWIYSKELGVLPTDRRDLFAVYQSKLHELWARRNSSTLETRLAYSFSDCLRTFPLPSSTYLGAVKALSEAGQVYHAHRSEICRSRAQGLTKTYNRFHDPEERDPEIVKLRDLHSALDRAALDAYGWYDIPNVCEFLLDSAINEEEWGSKKKPYRYRWPDEVRDDVLARLLKLNAERAAEEARAGASTPKKGRTRATLHLREAVEPENGDLFS